MSKPLDEPPLFMELLPINDVMIAGAFLLMDVVFFIIVVNSWGLVLSLLFTVTTSYSVFWILIFKNRMPRGFFDFVVNFMTRPKLLVPGRERSRLTKKELQDG